MKTNKPEREPSAWLMGDQARREKRAERKQSCTETEI
nr:MAG TPA: hypothetical protein [Caudoviricetes sp.]